VDDFHNLLIVGGLLGRMHRSGAIRPFQHRPRLDCQGFGHDSRTLISERFIPADLKANYDSLTADLLHAIDEIMAQAGSTRFIRLHGDCHAGNILWRDDAPHLVDFDDARMAPAIQDIWMMLSGDRPHQTAQLAEVLDGYSEFFDFQPRELRLIEALRTLRMLHFTAWLARRWGDPTFPRHFSWFNTPRYWGEHILQLREQVWALTEPALETL
jgi:Ser/Thr protein kinase RdoA (MazF antagonist)